MKYLRVFALFCLVLSYAGCGGPKTLRAPVPYESQNEYTVDDVITEMVTEACSRLQTEGAKGRVALLDCYSASGKSTSLEGRISNVLLAKFSECATSGRTSFSIVQPQVIASNMAALDLSARAANIKNNADTWKRLGVQMVASCRWLPNPNESIKVIFEFFDVSSGGRQIFTIERTLEKDDDLRKLLGEKLPGMLIVESETAGSRVYVDGEFKGEITSDPISFEVPYGTHSLRIDRSGHKSFSKSVTIEERESEYLKVKFTQSHLAPMNSALLSALLPGLALAVYGPEAKDNVASASHGIAAALFYTAAICWVVDESKDDPFLTRDNDDRYKTIKNIELYTALGAYVGNIITGWFVGNEYRKETKRGVEIMAQEIPDRLIFYADRSHNGDMILKVGLKF